MDEDERPDVAGYLFGLAAEMAVKEVATHLPCVRRDDIFYKHFPELRTSLLDHLEGREAARLLSLIEPQAFMSEWDVKMRYSSSAEVRRRPIARWKQQAIDAVSLMGAWT